MQDKQLAVRYAPILHFDVKETIPLVAAGYTIFRETARSDSFPKRTLTPDACGLVIEYAFYWDYDIQHMYDLEHVWVWVAADSRVTRAEGSFHGKYRTLWEPGFPIGEAPDGTHVHAYCQPGKHAFLPDGNLFRLLPDWRSCCTDAAGGGVLVGGPFEGAYHSSPEQDAISAAHIREKYAFEPTLHFDQGAAPDASLLCPWESLKSRIPGRIARLCSELKQTTSHKGA